MKKKFAKYLAVVPLMLGVGTSIISCNSGDNTHERQPEMFSGEGDPTPELGQNGDKYINTLDDAVWEKQNGVWVKIKEGVTNFVVSFNLNGGSYADGSTTEPSQIVRDGYWATQPSRTPQKEHCTFLGWYPQGSENKWDFFNPVRGNLTLVAQYKVNTEDKIVVTIDPANGESTYQSETYAGDHFWPSSPTKAGYDFQGWYIKSTGEKYNGTITAAMAGETLEAHWAKAAFNINYEIMPNDEVMVTGLIDIFATSITIPEEINGRKVTAIKDSAFAYRTQLATVRLPKTVKTIGKGAFFGTWRLAEVQVDSESPYFTSVDGVLYDKQIEKLVVYPTKCPQTYTCPSTLKEIGAYAFADSKDMGITSIKFNEGLEVIGERAFYNNETITNITFPSSLKVVGAYAFYGPTYEQDEWISPQGMITNASMNEGLEEIGEAAFANQYFKNTFTMPSTVKKIGAYAFANCSAIEKAILPAGLEELGFNAFSACTGIQAFGVETGNQHFTAVDGLVYTKDMKKVVMCPSGRTDIVHIPEGVEEIGDAAFFMVDQLQDYDFPSTLTKIGYRAFSHCYELRSFAVPNTVTSVGKECFYNCESLTNVTLGTGLVEIGEAAFCDTKIAQIEIPASVRIIGEDAFYNDPIETLIFNEGVTTIMSGAFYNTRISTLTLPESVVTIGDYAFEYTNIKSVNITKNVKTIGKAAFNTRNGLDDITVDSANTSYSSKNGLLLDKAGKTLIIASNQIGTTIDEKLYVTVPSGIETIYESAFANKANVYKYVLPESLVTIGDYAFANAGSKLKEVDLGANIKSIGSHAFYGASGLTSINLPDGLEEIGDYAFDGAFDLTSVVIPDSVKTIGDSAFETCYSLTSLTLGSGLEEIGDFAFSNNRNTLRLIIGSKVRHIGIGAFSPTHSTWGNDTSSFFVVASNAYYSTASDGALLMDKDQTTIYALAGNTASVTIPSTTKAIADYGMSSAGTRSGAKRLTSLVIPSSVESIGVHGLAGHTKISALTIPSTVKYIGKEAFRDYLLSQTITFEISRSYALSIYDPLFLQACSATAVFKD